MAAQEDRKYPRKVKPTYIYSIISVALVLFMLGLLGLIVLHAHKLSEYFKENIEVSVILKDNVKEADIYKIQKRLDIEPYVKATKYISKEDAATMMKEEFDEDFLETLGYNPLYASIALNLKADYTNKDSMIFIEAQLLDNPEVSEIYYQRSLLELINDNVRKLGLIMAILSILLFIIAITLIDSTIRLAMYSNRFLIKSMQLVGAMRWFIIKPFMGKSILNGFISGLLAILALIGILYYGNKQIPELIVLLDPTKFLVLFIIILLIGILISWLSTYRAVRKYLYTKLDELY